MCWSYFGEDHLSIGEREDQLAGALVAVPLGDILLEAWHLVGGLVD